MRPSIPPSSVKLPQPLRERVKILADVRKRSVHAVMVQAIESHVVDPESTFSGSTNVEYLLETEDVGFAVEFVNHIHEESKRKLKILPLRGRFVPELDSIGKSYREISIKSYRIIYRVLSDQNIVRVLLVAHVKRDVEEILLSTVLNQQHNSQR